ncbi:MAG: putative alpha-galactosidase, partial [Chloroflexi bacterium]|nr:putative alpha-galactosidase [Chloroflexota bacterium]
MGMCACIKVGTGVGRNMTKIALIGAGSVIFAQNLIGDILSFPELAGCHIALMDIDPVRLNTSRLMEERLSAQLTSTATITTTLDRREALRDADYVINAIQVGGYDATL